MVVNCAAIAKDLIMSEIFGHEKGAFTDAKVAREGRIEAARGGILFLDEIGEMPDMTQASLLRVTEGGEYSRMGSNTMRKTDVQFVAATNKGVADQPGQPALGEIYIADFLSEYSSLLSGNVKKTYLS